MNQIEKLASASYLIKKANPARIISMLKSLGLLAGGGVVGNIIGRHSGYNTGYDKGLETGVSTTHKDLASGLTLLLQDIARKGKGVAQNAANTKKGNDAATDKNTFMQDFLRGTATVGGGLLGSVGGGVAGGLAGRKYLPRMIKNIVSAIDIENAKILKKKYIFNP